ncbi:heme-binding protein [Coraliomargarita sp. W4R72]
MLKLLTYLSFALIPLMSSAIEKAFPQTGVGAFEIKSLPAAKVIATHAEGKYFANNGRLFRPLFNYIRTRDIAMTTPVEAEMSPGVMYFYINSDADIDSLESTQNVTVHTYEERLVASHCARGSYSESNFLEATEALRTWLAKQDKYVAIGEPRGIFWNGPYIPGFFKRFEVHIPVQAKQD